MSEEKCQTARNIIEDQAPRIGNELEVLLKRHPRLRQDDVLHEAVMDIAIPFPGAYNVVLTAERFWSFTPFQCRRACDHFTQTDKFVFVRERLVDGLSRLRERCAAVDAAALHDGEANDPSIAAYMFVMRILAYAWECRHHVPKPGIHVTSIPDRNWKRS